MKCWNKILFTIHYSPFTQEAFTLAEVLITLGIIGVVAAMTIPTLMQNMNDNAFKVAYKRAYSDISQAFMQAIQENSLQPRTGSSDSNATTYEWAVLKGAFKVTQECTPAQLNDCWADGDKVHGTQPGTTNSSSFIDASGRSWAEYQNDMNIYLVDTNGFKSPNRFGKDRWAFALRNVDNSTLSIGLPAKVGILYNGDILTTADPMSSSWCKYPPCYYKSWLFNIGQ